MKKTFYLILFIFLSSCYNDYWYIKEFNFKNGKKVYLKKHSWGLREHNSEILSNNNEEKFNDKIDFDFGNLVETIYEVKNDSLLIYQSPSSKKYFKELDTLKFNNTKIIYVHTDLYFILRDSLNKFIVE